MWIRRRLDIGWTDIAWACSRCLFPTVSAANARHRLEAEWGGENEAVACLSVRTGFDLLLRALALPSGSEVLMSALNVPGMFRIVEAHGLAPVPLDLGPNLSPSTEVVRDAITRRSRAIVVAHLFGARADLAPIHALAQEHGLLLIEDRAQAFDGLPTTAPEGCDAALYSFGTIKTATAFGGAMLTIRDPSLAERIRSLERTLPPQTRWAYLARLLKYAAAKTLTGKRTYAALLKALASAGADPDAWLQSAAAGFPAAELLNAIRHRPSPPNLALMERRIQHFDPTRAKHQRQRGIQLAAALGHDFPVAGDPTTHTFDLFPLRLGNPKTVQAALCKAGFDTTMRGSIVTAPCPKGNPTANVARECAEPPPALMNQRALGGKASCRRHPAFPSAR